MDRIELKLSFYFLILGLTILGSCQTPEKAPANDKQAVGWTAVFKNDKEGNPISGNIDSLVAGIRNGYDLRVGWGWERQLGDSIMRLEHMAPPIYLSIIQEKTVSVIIEAHPMLQSYLDAGNQKFGEGGHFWQCIMTTNGSFNAQVYNRSTGELIRDWPQRHTITWFLDYPAQRRNSGPLY